MVLHRALTICSSFSRLAVNGKLIASEIYVAEWWPAERVGNRVYEHVTMHLTPISKPRIFPQKLLGTQFVPGPSLEMRDAGKGEDTGGYIPDANPSLFHCVLPFHDIVLLLPGVAALMPDKGSIDSAAEIRLH